MLYFTSITANYIPKARILAHSLKEHNPTAKFHVVLSDKLPQTIDISNEPFDSIVYLEDLGIPNLNSWAFKHTVVELCTAVKGQAFLFFFEEYQAEKIVYLDPDIAVFSDLIELENLLSKHSIILTPHLTFPENNKSAILDNEISGALQHGIYNLGFLAVRTSPCGLAFLIWWRDRLLDFCYDDIPKGLFTDQRWIDLAPAFFDDILILRDPSYNVATWNITNREMTRDPDNNKTILIENIPLKFYHFTGFDSGACFLMVEKYGKNNAVLKNLCEWYITELNKHEQEFYGKIPCFYSSYSNGENITLEQRILYRANEDISRAFPSPFNAEGYYNWYWYNKFNLAGNSNNNKKAVRRLFHIRYWKRKFKKIFS